MSEPYVTGTLDPGRCCRCGFPVNDRRESTCFPCAMLEDPAAEQWEVDMAMKSLAKRGDTYAAWKVRRVENGYPINVN